METIPKPLCKQLVLTILVGTSCFFIGLVFYIYEKDTVLFLLSTILFLFSLGKGILNYFRFRNKAYHILEGICTEIHSCLFTRFYQVFLEDSGGNIHQLLLDKNSRVNPGFYYRFYFKKAACLSPGKNPLLQKAFSTGNLLGFEILGSMPSEITVSNNNSTNNSAN